MENLSLIGSEPRFIVPVVVTEWLFAFVLSKQSVLRSSPSSTVIEMLHLEELTKDREGTRTTAEQLGFSLNGETVYVVSSEAGRTRFTAWDVSSGELKAEKNTGSEVSSECCPLAVREGVLVRTSSDSLELWNFELSECVRSWTDVRGVTEMISISEERVACAERGASQVIVLDTTSENKVSTVKLVGEFITCNNKCQLTRTRGAPSESIRLWQGQTVLWEKCWPSSVLVVKPALFSPADQFVLITVKFALPGKSVYVLDAVSGDPLHMLCKAQRIYCCTFVTDEECVMHSSDPSDGLSSFRLQMFNVRTGDLLSVMDMEHEVSCLASCPGKGLIAIGFNHLMLKLKFKVIQVHLPGKNKDKKKSRRSVHIYKQTVFFKKQEDLWFLTDEPTRLQS